MRLNYVVVLLLVFPSAVLGEAKLLKCAEEYEGGSGNQIKREWQAVFDTDDFSKENPEYEFRLLTMTIDGAPTRGSIVGNKYRYKFKVTPSTLTFEFCLSEATIHSGCLNAGFSVMSTANVSRSDLSISYGECSIEDYGVDNLI